MVKKHNSPLEFEYRILIQEMLRCPKNRLRPNLRREIYTALWAFKMEKKQKK
jgi:hypothetical protein